MVMSPEQKKIYEDAIEVYKKHLQDTIKNNPPYRIKIVASPSEINNEKDVMYVYNGFFGHWNYQINGRSGKNYVEVAKMDITENDVKETLPDVLTHPNDSYFKENFNLDAPQYLKTFYESTPEQQALYKLYLLNRLYPDSDQINPNGVSISPDCKKILLHRRDSWTTWFLKVISFWQFGFGSYTHGHKFFAAINNIENSTGCGAQDAQTRRWPGNN